MRRWKSRQLFFVWCAFCFVCFFPRDVQSPHWGGEGEFVLFSINQFSQPFNSEIYIHIADLLLSLLHPGTIYFFFFFSCRFLSPLLLWRFIGLVFWMSERIRTRNLSTTPYCLSLSISPFFFHGSYLCVHCFHFSFLYIYKRRRYNSIK